MGWTEFIIKIGAVAGAITAVGRLLIGVYKKLVTDPYNIVLQRVQEENTKDLKRSLSPLTQAIDRLNELLDDSKADRELLHRKNDEQDNKIDNHETRITVLEDWRKGR